LIGEVPCKFLHWYLVFTLLRHPVVDNIVMLTELVGINNIDTYQPRVRVTGKERKGKEKNVENKKTIHIPVMKVCRWK
jgi:hypothetical protein